MFKPTKVFVRHPVRIVFPHPVLRLGLTIKIDREYSADAFTAYVQEFGGIATNAESAVRALDQTADLILIEFECYRRIGRRLPLRAAHTRRITAALKLFLAMKRKSMRDANIEARRNDPDDEGPDVDREDYRLSREAELEGGDSIPLEDVLREYRWSRDRMP